MVAILFWLALHSASMVRIVPVWNRMVGSEYCAHLPVVLIALLLLVALRWNRVCRLPSGAISWSLVVVGIACLAGSYPINSPWLGACSWCLFVLAFLVTSARRTEEDAKRTLPKAETSGLWNRTRSGTLGALAPLALMALPLPRNYDVLLVSEIYQLVFQTTSFFLDFLSIPNHWQPTSLRLTMGALSRTELLIGLFSPMTCGFAMVLIQSVKSRPVWLFPFYFGSGLVASIVANTLFVMTSVLANVFGRINITAVEFRFTAITAVALVTFFLLLSLDRFWSVTFFPTRTDSRNDWNNPLIKAWNRAFGLDIKSTS
jgi:hypothetical protein